MSDRRAAFLRAWDATPQSKRAERVGKLLNAYGLTAEDVLGPVPISGTPPTSSAPEPTDAELAEWLAEHARPVLVAARGRERRSAGKRTTEIETRSAKTADEVAALARWLPGGANRGGRTSEHAARLADYRTAILALSREGYGAAQITATEVLRRLHRTGSESQLRKDVSDPDVGGWKAFRLRSLRER